MPNYCGESSGLSGVFSAVTGQIELLTGYASEALSATQDAVGQLADFTVAFQVPQATFTRSGVQISPYTKAEQPTLSVLEFHSPQPVADPTLAAVPDVTGVAPTFTASAPMLQIPPQPQPLNAIPPGAPPTLSVIQTPAPPDDTLPALPTLSAYTLPVIAPLNLSSLRAAFADLWAHKPPLDVTETLGDNYLPTYQSMFASLLQGQASYVNGNGVNGQLISVLLELLNGNSIGIPMAVEAQTWARDSVQIDREADKAVRAARQEWAARGETLPGGPLDFHVAMARQEATRGKLGVIRDRLIKRTEWQIENFTRAVGQGITFLDLERKQFIALQNLSETLAYHAFDVSSKVVEVALKVREIVRTNWVAAAQVFDTWLKLELSELEKIKAELEVQQLIGNINRDLLAQYNARLDGIGKVFALFKDKIEALNLILGQDKLRLDGYASTIQSFLGLNQAKTAEWGGYGEAVRGELGKAQIFDTLAGVFGKEMQAYATDQESQRANANIRIEGNKLLLEKFKAFIERNIAELNTEVQRLETLVKGDGLKVQLYTANNSSERDRVESGARLTDIDTRQGEATANIELKKSDLQIQQMLAIKQMLVQAMEAIARTEASVAGSALSAAHVGATISDGYTNTTGCNTSYSVSIEGQAQ